MEQPLKLFEISAFSELKERYNINSNEVGQIPYKDEWYVEKKFFVIQGENIRYLEYQEI